MAETGGQQGAAVSEQPSVNFHMHLYRGRNPAGARQDFEEMIGRLVAATTDPEASLLDPSGGGDWGIDVFVGDLNGQTAIWQAKYFIHGIHKSQRDQITRSFGTVIKRAREKGFVVDRWVLCVPASMDPETQQWWGKWQAERHRETGVDIELWSENQLRGLLLTPDAEDVYRHYYAPDLHAAGPGRPFTPRRLAALGALGVFAAFVAVGIWQLFPVTGSGPAVPSASTSPVIPRTQQEWATDVNQACRLTEPTLAADVRAITDLPPSAFESVPMDPRVPKAFERLTVDEAEITHLFRQAFTPPSTPDAAVRQWLTALNNRDVTLAKATMYSQKVSSGTGLPSYIDRIPASIYIQRFVSQTNSMRPLTAQLGLGNCV